MGQSRPWLLFAFVAPYLVNGILRDRSQLPDTADLLWPQWYRDTNNLPVGLCKSQTSSPNAPGSAMCLPIVPVPGSFAGNIGAEALYSMLTVRITSPGLNLVFEAVLEAAYASADGNPEKGTEVVFTRIRVTAEATVAGDYTIFHPFGKEVFPGVQPGQAAIKYTRDIGLGSFDDPLNGDVGPFIEWVNTAGTGRTNAGETLEIFNPTLGRAERFLGDPNVLHAFKGSPTSFNKVRVEGPTGMSGGTGTAGVDAAGKAIESMEQTQGSVVGQEWTVPVPTPFEVTRALYTRTPTLFTEDVWATSAPGQELIVTGLSPIGNVMSEVGAGNYHVHLEFDTAPTLPLSVTVYNTRSQVISRTAPLEDIVTIRQVTLNRATNTLQITATSSDTSTAPPTLQLVEPTVAAGTFTRDATGLYTLSAALAVTSIPPLTVRVTSSNGGSRTGTVTTIGSPMNGPAPPTAADDSFVIDSLLSTSMPIDVLVNDVTSAVPTIFILTQPTRLGTVSVPATGGPITLTRDIPSITGRDSFTYILRVGTAMSNVATVNIITAFQGASAGPAPIVAADTFVTRISTTTGSVDVLANDVAAPGGSPIDPSTIVVTAGTGGTPVFNQATQTVTYTAPDTPGLYTFTYTVASLTGSRSLPATVSADVRQAAETLTIVRARFRGGRWIVDGTTTFFGPTASGGTVSCSWNQCPSAARPCTPTAVSIGSGLADALGVWAVDAVGVTVAPTQVTLESLTCRSSFGATATTTTVRFR